MSQNYFAQAEKCFSFMSTLIELSNGKNLTGYRMIVHMREFGFNVSPGTVYSQLERLSRDGVIRGKRQPWGKTEKTVYEMTEKGMELFQQFKKNWRKPLEYVYRHLNS